MPTFSSSSDHRNPSSLGPAFQFEAFPLPPSGPEVVVDEYRHYSIYSISNLSSHALDSSFGSNQNQNSLNSSFNGSNGSNGAVVIIYGSRRWHDTSRYTLEAM